MGYQMAKNLQSKLSTSDTVRLYDINRDVMQRLAGEMKTSSKADTTGGAAVELAESGEAASAGADTVITVLPEPIHVKTVYKAIIASQSQDGNQKPCLFIDCSTIDPSSSREVANAVAPAGRDYAGGFGIALMRKDLGLAITAAQEAGAKLELADRAKKVYDAADKEERCKGRDFSVVYRHIGGKE